MPLSLEVEIRKLKLWEIPKLIEFRSRNDYHAQSEEKGESESLFYSFLKTIWHRHRMGTFAATRGSAIVGYVSIILGRQRKFRENVYLVSAAVEPNERGQGIGTLLFNKVESYARTRNAKRIELEVFSRNTEAIKLYKRLGYEVEGVKRHAVESANDYDDLVIMAKLLN